MPLFPYVQMGNAFARRDPLGPQTLNQLQQNIEAIDGLARVEHFNDGQHNASEIPWVLGHLEDGSPPTGYLFDTAFGGGTLARPATGRYTVSVAAGVIPTALDGSTLLTSIIANVSDPLVESLPHTITAEVVSDTSVQFRIRKLDSALGAGNTWVDINRDFDIAIHAPQQSQDVSLLSSYLLKQRRDFLTEAATDWNALVQNQGTVRAASLLEHTSAGNHSVNRIAKAVGWFQYSAGPSFTVPQSQGVKSASCSRISTGVYEVVLDDNFTSLTSMACFPEVQPATPGELVVINGKAFATGAGTSAFRFYVYAYDSGANTWDRADRSFFASMFGVIA